MDFINKITWRIILFVISMISLSSCKKVVKLPEVITGTVTHVVQTSAYSGGEVTSDGGGHVTARGVCWNISTEPTIDNNKTSDSTGTGLFSSYISGLNPNTMYYLRAYAINSEGTSYGDQVIFTTREVDVPTLITSGFKCVTAASSMGGGDVSNDGGIPVTARGVCWNSAGSPTLADSYTLEGTGTGLFSSTLTDLTLNATYYVRAYATNSLGTGYGNEVEFTQMGPVIDHEGNVYSVVTIGTQIWLGENLKTGTYNDGTEILYVTNGIDWAYTAIPAFCWYENKILDFKSPYGALYNWYAVNTGKLCPTGWHVPSVKEFTTLISFFGGDNIAGGKLKEAGTSHWAAPNLEATNISGFSALPGGGRYNVIAMDGTFTDLGYYGYLWSATASTSTMAFSYDMGFDLTLVNKGEYSKRDGESVRCIKDNE
jgi:uncharacterized protein (TIGR02145 family)